MTIGRMVIGTPLGPLAVAGDDQAILEVAWGAALDCAPPALVREAADQLEAYFAGRLTRFELPLRPAGTPFQRTVWRHLCEVPYGTTVTYGAVSKSVGSGARAVGLACARNPIAVIVPCHRIVGSGNRLTGYSGGQGLATKAALLALEGCARPLENGLPSQPIAAWRGKA